MATLIQRIKSHNTGQTTSGQNTLILTHEAIEHMFGPSGDWTPLAHLIGGSQPTQSRIVRKIVLATINGWNIAKAKEPKKGDPLVRFNKMKDSNQGVDQKQMEKLQSFIDGKKSIQSEAVIKSYTTKPAVKRETDLPKWAEGVAKRETDAEILKRIQEHKNRAHALEAALKAAKK